MHNLLIIFCRACLWPQPFVLAFYLGPFMCNVRGRLWVVSRWLRCFGILVLNAAQITLFMLQSFYFKLQFSRCVSSTAWLCMYVVSWGCLEWVARGRVM